MHHVTSTAYLTTDSGLVIEVMRVSTVFVRVGANRRGRFADRRAARTRRTDARQARRGIEAFADETLDFVRSSARIN